MLPRPVVAGALKHPLLGGVLPTDVGYFPAADGHLRERAAGVEQAIFIYCSKGAGWCEMAGERHRVVPGDLLVVPSGTPHAYGAEAGTPWTIHWFHAQGSQVAAFIDELDLSCDRPVVRIGGDPGVIDLFEELLEGLEHGYTPANLLYASCSLAHLLATLVRDRRDGGREQPAPSQKIAQTLAYIRRHLASPLQLDALAALAGLSRSQYSALFRRQTGYAPIDYLIRLRMHRACQLLDTTELSVKAVAAQVGYEDPLYFSRVFRRVNEQSPKEYRRTRKG